MPFDKQLYEESKLNVQSHLIVKSKTAYEFMQEYELAIINENYEMAKAITDVLAPLGYQTADTHKHIHCLN